MKSSLWVTFSMQHLEKAVDHPLEQSGNTLQFHSQIPSSLRSPKQLTNLPSARIISMPLKSNQFFECKAAAASSWKTTTLKNETVWKISTFNQNQRAKVVRIYSREILEGVMCIWSGREEIKSYAKDVLLHCIMQKQELDLNSWGHQQHSAADQWLFPSTSYSHSPPA